MTTHALLHLGLSEQEAALYETLLPLGAVPMADLVAAAKLHPQIVYRLVERLEAKGFAVVETRKHRKTVMAEDPGAIQYRQEQKLEELKNAVPMLMALKGGPGGPIVHLHRGPEAVRSLRLRGIFELKKGGTYDVIGGSGDRYYEAMGGKLEEIERKREKAGVKKRILAFSSQRKLIEKHEKGRKLVECRYLPEGYVSPASTNVFGDVTAIILWAADPIVIVIESAEIAESYRQMFMTLWKAAGSAA